MSQSTSTSKSELTIWLQKSMLMWRRAMFLSAWLRMPEP
jgi:hypothetical protein